MYGFSLSIFPSWFVLLLYRFSFPLMISKKTNVQARILSSMLTPVLTLFLSLCRIGHVSYPVMSLVSVLRIISIWLSVLLLNLSRFSFCRNETNRQLVQRSCQFFLLNVNQEKSSRLKIWAVKSRMNDSLLSKSYSTKAIFLLDFFSVPYRCK